MRWKNACRYEHSAHHPDHWEWRTHRERNQDHHQRALRYSTRIAIFVASEEEQGRQQDLLNIQTHKHMLQRLREEAATAVRRARLPQLPEEPVLPENVEQEECRRREAVDDRLDD